MTMRPANSGDDATGTLPYSRFPGQSRITCERTAAGLRLTLPPLGTWHHAKWGLLFGSWMILPTTALLILYSDRINPQLLARVWRPLLLEGTLYPFLAVIFVSILAGYVLGRIRTTLVIDADSFTLVRELWGLRGEKSWKREDLRDVRTFFKHIRIVSRKAILRTQFGVASTAEAKWLARCLREELGFEPAAPAAETLQRAA